MRNAGLAYVESRPRRQAGIGFDGVEAVMNQTVKLTRTTEVIEIPSGRVSTLPENISVRIMQSRGDSYTVWTDYGQMYRIDGKDADALGLQAHAASSVAEHPVTL